MENSSNSKTDVNTFLQLNNALSKRFCSSQFAVKLFTSEPVDSSIEKYKRLFHNPKGESEYSRDILKRDYSWLESIGLANETIPDLSHLPAGSFYLSIPFTLAEHYLSKDDEAFYPIDNPVRKDKAFKVPMVAPSSWKGCLHAVCVRYLAEWAEMAKDLVFAKESYKGKCSIAFAEKRRQIARIFGDEKGESTGVDNHCNETGKNRETAKFIDELLLDEAEEQTGLSARAREAYRKMMHEAFGSDKRQPLPHHQGRLRIYPTFFDAIDCTMINPHDRKTKTNRNPVTMECVPKGTKGRLSMLYLPWPPGKAKDRDAEMEALEDMKLLANAAYDVLRTYGFGAKTSSIGARAEEKLPEDCKVDLILRIGEKGAGSPSGVKMCATLSDVLNRLAVFFSASRSKE